MDPVRLALALGPLAVYLLLVGAINLSRRPFVTTGARDTAALGVAVSGLMIIGPIELFMPRAAVVNFGAFIWVLLLAFYLLCLTLVVLLMRPRLVVYNVSLEEFRPVLAEAVTALDHDVRWAGNSLLLPNLGIEMHIETFPVMRNISLVAAHDQQNFRGWRRLEHALAQALARVEVARNPRGAAMILIGLMMTLMVYWELVRDPQGAVQALNDFLMR